MNVEKRLRHGRLACGILAAMVLPGCVGSPGIDALQTAAVTPSETAEPISGSRELDRAIVKHARANDVPVPLAFGVVRVESGFNPKAVGPGVYGLSQIKPATARSMGFSGGSNDLLKAETNLKYGMRYLKGAWEKGDRRVCGAVMKYTGGLRATRLSAAGRRYCEQVKRTMKRIAESRPDLVALKPAEAETAVAALAREKAAETARPRHRPSMVERRDEQR